MQAPVTIGKFKVDYYPPELLALHKELDDHHKDLQAIMPGGMDLITTLNYLAGVVGIALDGQYLIKDVAESIRVKLVARRLIVTIPPTHAEELPPLPPEVE